MEDLMSAQVREVWASGAPYEQYVGRWSRRLARQFLVWLGIPSGQAWADVGCGTGALVEGILTTSEPQAIFAIDRSKGFLAAARSTIPDQRVRFALADATALPWASGFCAASVSGLVLNFVSDALAMVREMVRVTRPSGQVAAYVWDYSGGMEMMRHFWDAVVEVNPADTALDEAERFPLCQPKPLRTLFQQAGLTGVVVRSIGIPTVFRDFDDYWIPFLGKQGSAPTYLASQDSETRARIRASLQARLPTAADGSISLTAQAWAVQGIV
jgi:SAM-dependent methyltransferase